jgi:FkbM family methyltransferase
MKRRVASWRFGEYGGSPAAALSPLDRHNGVVPLVRLGPDVWLRAPAALQPEIAAHVLGHPHGRSELNAFIEEAKRRPGVLLDVGAYKGFFALVFCAARADNIAILYEPARSALDVAVEAIAANGFSDRATTHVAALGAREATARVVTDATGYARFLNEPAAQGVEVPVLTIDQECARTGARPTVLKIDTEGAELDVLRGAAETLETGRPVVFLEIHLDLLEQRRATAHEVCRFLSRLGYRWFSTAGWRLPAFLIHQSPRAVHRVVARPDRR